MAASLVTGRAAGYDQCNAIVDYIRNSIQYTPGVGQEIISASELNQLGSGVCRDMVIWVSLVAAHYQYLLAW